MSNYDNKIENRRRTFDNEREKEYHRVNKGNHEPLDEFEVNSKDFESKYEPLDENAEEVKELKLNYEPLTEPRNSYYSTIDFITDIKSEISKLVPENELHGGRISYDKLSKYLGMHKSYIRDTRSRIQNPNNIKNNPDFKFSKDQLKSFLSSIFQNLGDKDYSKLIEIFSKYSAMNELLDYRQQQWNLHNPDLKKEFFKYLDNTAKGYYFGLLLADGTNEKEKIGLFLEKEDLKVINQFRDALGISNKIEHKIDQRKRKITGKYPERYGVRVGCTPMMEDLRKLGFFDFKKGRALKNGFFTNLERPVALSVLLGFYDGDGEEGAPIIHSCNRKFLHQVKKEFNIRYNIQLKKAAGKEFVWIGESEIKSQYYLRIGPELFNQAMESYKYSMERKREYFPMRMGKHAYDILTQKVNSKEILEKLILIGPRKYLADNLGCSFDLFKRLCDDYGIKALPHSYWKKAENKNWKSSFEKKFNEFKNKFLNNS
jgi:hypothetical protein